ncbi:MAG: mannose-1-phosphate guanylyltransferase [Bacillota bacterium]
MLNILIMAGGKGERFWPKSRANHPKQLLNLTGEGTLIRETFQRVQNLTDISRIFVVTGAEIADSIIRQLPEIPAQNIIIEPESKNTAPCIGLAALHIEMKDPDGIMAVLPSDHVIKKKDEFCRLLREGEKVVRQFQGVVTLGVKPNRPETGYGYIKRGQALIGANNIFAVEKFEEKPDLEKAKQYLAEGEYLWNSGIFIWKVSEIRKLIREFLPALHRGLEKIKRTLCSASYQQTLHKEYHKFKKVSVDYGVIERIPALIHVIPADIGWDDVGDWGALSRVKKKDQKGNILLGQNLLALDLEDCIMETQGKKLVAAIGLNGIIFIETEDAILICAKNRSQDIKTVLEKLNMEGKKQFA